MIGGGRQPRAACGGISVTYHASSGAVVDTTLERMRENEVTAGVPVREYR